MTVILVSKVVAPPSEPTPAGSTPPSAQWVAPQDLVGCVDCDTCVNLQLICDGVAEQLYIASGRRFGVRRALIRPHRVVPSGGAWCVGGDGSWAGARHSLYDGWDGYGVRLSGPVVEVHEVKLHGDVLAADDFVVVDGHTLMLASGAPWPDDQNVARADSEVGTFSVDYSYGPAVPAAGRFAAQAWACELAKAQAGDECALPDNVVSQVRQGISQVFSTASASGVGVVSGPSGLQQVDAWVRQVNPARATRPATVVSPDTMQGATL